MKRLCRSDTDRVIAGVCGGLAAHLRLDSLVVRILFAVLATLNGAGVVLYLLLWILLPISPDERRSPEEVIRSNAEEIRGRAHELTREARGTFGGDWEGQGKSGGRMLAIGTAFVGIGVLLLLRNFGFLLWIGKLWPLVVVALGVALLLNGLHDRR